MTAPLSSSKVSVRAFRTGVDLDWGGLELVGAVGCPASQFHHLALLYVFRTPGCSQTSCCFILRLPEPFWSTEFACWKEPYATQRSKATRWGQGCWAGDSAAQPTSPSSTVGLSSSSMALSFTRGCELGFACRLLTGKSVRRGCV